MVYFLSVNLKWNIMIVFEILLCFSFLILCIVCINLICCIKKKNVTDIDIENRLVLMQLLPCLLITIIVIILLMIQLNGVNLFGTSLDVAAVFGTMFTFSLLAYSVSYTVKKIVRVIYTSSIVSTLDKFCLFLRPFYTDKKKLTFEGRFCKVAKNLYPLFAVGDPGRLLQPLGADRIYVSEQNWKFTVSELMKKAKVVFFRVGETDGFNWEIENCIEFEYYYKSIFIVTNDNEYELLKQKLEKSDLKGFPILSFTNVPIALFLEKEYSKGEWKIFKVGDKKSIRNLLNSFLHARPCLDADYSAFLHAYNHPLKYLFKDSFFPKDINYFSWGMFFPLLFMLVNHWSIVYYMLFIVFLIVSAYLESMIPIGAYLLFCFLYGQRISWLSYNWGSIGAFKKCQRSVNYLMFFTLIISVLLSLLYEYVSS